MSTNSTSYIYRAIFTGTSGSWIPIQKCASSGEMPHEEGYVKKSWLCHLCKNISTENGGVIFKVIDVKKSKFALVCSKCVQKDIFAYYYDNETQQVILESL